MNNVRATLFLSITLFLVACNTDGRPTNTEKGQHDSFTTSSVNPCTNLTDEARTDITEHANGKVSVCRLDGKGDCLYTEAFGKTFVSSRPNFNGDNLADFLIKDFTGAYGDHDIVHHLGYLACPQNGYVKVLDAFVTSAQADEAGRKEGQWARVEITRDCYDDRTQSLVSRRYELSWDSDIREYGPTK